MGRRSYDQACSLAGALDRVGERWSLLVIRELMLGPLRFSDLVRGTGGAPTDVLTRRLRDLEAEGIVRRRELGPPVAATVYELTSLGRELDRAMLELGRWGLNFYDPADVREIEPSWLPNSLRLILQPPPDAALTVQLHAQGHAYCLRIENGAVAAARGEAGDADLVLTGAPPEVVTLLVLGAEAAPGVAVEGDPRTLEELREMVVIPQRLRDAATARAGSRTEAAA